MQLLQRSSTDGASSYTADQVKAQLIAGPGAERHYFDRLDANLKWIADLTPSVDMESIAPTIDHDSSRVVPRTLRIRVSGDAGLQPLKDLIRPRYQILMPDGRFVEFEMGIFTLLPTARQIATDGSWVDLQGAELTQLLLDSGFAASTGLPSQTGVTAGAANLIVNYGGPTLLKVLMPDPGKQLPAAMGWQYGTSPLSAANDLMAAVNYFRVVCDEKGVIYSRAIPDWTKAVADYTIDATGPSHAIVDPISTQPNYDAAFNIAIVVIEDPRGVALSAQVVNNRPDSPISTTNWHQKAKVIRDSRVVDYATAERVGLAALQEAARIYAPYVVTTLPFPAWQDQDVCRLIFSTADEGLVDRNCVVQHWTHELRAGGRTTQYLAPIVPAGPWPQ